MAPPDYSAGDLYQSNQPTDLGFEPTVDPFATGPARAPRPQMTQQAAGDEMTRVARGDVGASPYPKPGRLPILGGRVAPKPFYQLEKPGVAGIPGTERTGLPGVQSVAQPRVEYDPLGARPDAQYLAKLHAGIPVESDEIPSAQSMPGAAGLISKVGSRSALGVVKSLGTSGRLLGDTPGQRGMIGLKQAGTAIEDVTQLMLDQIPPPTLEESHLIGSKNFVEDPNQLRNPYYMANLGANAGGSMVAFMLPEIALFRGAALAATGARAGVLSSIAETMANSAEVYQQAKDAGMSEIEAADLFRKNIPLDFPITYGMNRLGIFNDKLKSRAARAVLSPVTEAGQEVGQAVPSNYLLKQPLFKGWEENALGSVIGGPVGAMMSPVQSLTGEPPTPHHDTTQYQPGPQGPQTSRYPLLSQAGTAAPVVPPSAPHHELPPDPYEGPLDAYGGGAAREAPAVPRISPFPRVQTPPPGVDLGHVRPLDKEGEKPPEQTAPPEQKQTPPPAPNVDAVYEDAKTFAADLPELGVSAIRRQFGVTKDDARVILDRMVADGLFAQKELKGGGTSFVNLAWQRGQAGKGMVTKGKGVEEAVSEFLPPDEDEKKEEAPPPGQQAPPPGQPPPSSLEDQRKEEGEQRQQEPPALGQAPPPASAAPPQTVIREVQSGGPPPPAAPAGPTTRMQPKEGGGYEIVPVEDAGKVTSLEEAQAPKSKVVRANPNTIEADPVRFQFKRDTGGEAGVGEELKDPDVPWNEELAGVVSVWKDPADGKTYVVNGHHRLEKAKRMGVESIDVRYLDAKDAQEARAKGALQNIAEGRGTSIDAAKFMRDMGLSQDKLKSYGVHLKGEKARQGSALAKLPDALFDEVVAGDLSIERASIIGEGLDNQKDMTVVAAGAKKMNDAQLRELIRRTRYGPRIKASEQSQGSIFGDDFFNDSLAREQAIVSQAIRDQLAKEKKLFSAVGTTGAATTLQRGGNVIAAEKNKEIAENAAQALEIYDALSLKAGPVEEAINNAAMELAKGGKLADVKEKAYAEAIRAVQSVQATLRGEAPPHGERTGGVDQGRKPASEPGRGGAPPAGPAKAAPAKVEEIGKVTSVEQGETFTARMQAAQTADDGRGILGEAAKAINALQRAIGVTPTVGQIEPNYTVGLHVLNNKTIQKAVQEAKAKDPAKAAQLDALMRDVYHAHEKEWPRLLGIEDQKESERFEEFKAQRGPKLPKELTKAAPRYGAFELQFESDVDKAAYITAQAKPSKRDADYLKFVMDATGKSEAEVRKAGAAIRTSLKTIAKGADPADGPLEVPLHVQVKPGEDLGRVSSVEAKPKAAVYHGDVSDREITEENLKNDVETGVWRFATARGRTGKGRTGTVYTNQAGMRVLQNVFEMERLEGVSMDDVNVAKLLTALDKNLSLRDLSPEGRAALKEFKKNLNEYRQQHGPGASISFVVAERGHGMGIRKTIREELIHGIQRIFGINSVDTVENMLLMPAFDKAWTWLEENGYPDIGAMDALDEITAKVLAGEDVGLTLEEQLTVAKAYRKALIEAHGNDVVTLFRYVKAGEVKETFRGESRAQDNRRTEAVQQEGGFQLQRGAVSGRESPTSRGGRGEGVRERIAPTVEPVGKITGFISRLAGGSQAQLVKADNGKYYVVKFIDNPQGPRIPINELIAGRIMHALGLRTPFPVVLDYAGDLDLHYPVYNKPGGDKISRGSGIATEYVVEPRQKVYENDASEQDPGFLDKVNNLGEFVKALVVDKWLGNADSRQVVFHKDQNGEGYVVTLIDNAFSFGASQWEFGEDSDNIYDGLYYRTRVYRDVQSMDDFAPMIAKIRKLDPEFIRETFRQIPPEYVRHASEADRMALAEELIRRRARIESMIKATIAGDTYLFQNWKGPLARRPGQGLLFSRKKNVIEGGRAQIGLFDWAATAATGQEQHVVEEGLTKPEARETVKWLEKSDIPGTAEAAKVLEAAVADAPAKEPVKFETTEAPRETKEAVAETGKRGEQTRIEMEEQPDNAAILQGERLTAAFAGELSPEEKRRKLKRAEVEQTGLFETSEERVERPGLLFRRDDRKTTSARAIKYLADLASGKVKPNWSHAYEAVTRLITSTKSKEYNSPDLLVTGQGFEKKADGTWKNPEAIKRAVNLIKNYANFDGKKYANDEARIEAFVEHVKENLIWLYKKYEAQHGDLIKRAKQWYDGGRKLAERYAKVAGVEPHQMSAVIAVLSPKKDWFQNIDLARRIADFWAIRHKVKWNAPAMEKGYAKMLKSKAEMDEDTRKKTEKRNKVRRARLNAKNSRGRKKARETGVAFEAAVFEAEVFTPSRDLQKAYARIRGKAFAEIKRPYDRAVWMRMWDEGHHSRNYNVLTPEGESQGVATSTAEKTKGKPLTSVWQSYDAVTKALSILDDGSMKNISAKLGKQHKVRSFYNNIVDPDSPNLHVTIDTHAVAAGFLRPLGQWDKEVKDNLNAPSKVSGESPTYGLVARAYREAAAEMGLLPREFQSITWEAVRGLFSPSFKKGNKTVIKNIWIDVAQGKMTAAAAREKIYGLAGKIDRPAWAGAIPGRVSDTRTDVGRQAAADTKAVPGHGAPRSGSERAAGHGTGGGTAAAVRAPESKRGTEPRRGVGTVQRALGFGPGGVWGTPNDWVERSAFKFATKPSQTGSVYANRSAMNLIGYVIRDTKTTGASFGSQTIQILLDALDGKPVPAAKWEKLNLNDLSANAHKELAKFRAQIVNWKNTIQAADPQASLNFVLASPAETMEYVKETASEEYIHGAQRHSPVGMPALVGMMKTAPFQSGWKRLIQIGYDVSIDPADSIQDIQRKAIEAFNEVTAKVLSGQELGLSLAERIEIAKAYRKALINFHGSDTVLLRFKYVKAGAVRDAFFDKQPAATAAPVPAAATTPPSNFLSWVRQAAGIAPRIEERQAPSRRIDEREQTETAPDVMKAKRPPQQPQQPATQAVTTINQPPATGAAAPAMSRSARFDQLNETVDKTGKERDKTRYEKFKESLTTFGHSMTRQFVDIPAGATYASFKQKLNFVSKAQGTAIHKAAQAIIDQLEKLSPAQYDAFVRVIFYDDLAARVKQQIDEGTPVLDKDIGWGIKDSHELYAMRAEARDRVRNDPQIVEALRQRKAMWAKIKPEYIAAMKKAGVDIEKALSRKDYFRHRVIEHLQAQELPGNEGTGAGQRFKLPTGRSWLKKAHVNAKAYSIDYIRAEFEVLSEMMYDTERAGFIGWLKHDSGHNIAPRLMRQAAAHNKKVIMPTFVKMAKYYNKKNPRATPVTAEMMYQRVMKSRPNDPGWRTRVTKRMAGADYIGSLEKAYNTFALKTHQIYTADKRDHFFFKPTISDALANAIEAAGMGTVLANQIQKLKVKGKRRGQMVLPREVIETMKEFMQPPSDKTSKWTEKLWTKPMGWWKQSKLIHPVSVVKYNLRNLSGDLERVVIANPKALKMVGRSTMEIRQFLKTGKPPSKEFEAWWRRGGMDANLQVAEIGDVNKLRKLKHLREDFRSTSTADKGIDYAVDKWERVWGKTRQLTDFREGILRYATFLEYQRQIAANAGGRPDNFGASLRDEVMAIRNHDDRAYKLSNDLMLAYDEVSALGQRLRRNWVPFWSFQEKNAQAYKRLVGNAVADGRTSAAIGYAALGGAAVAARVGVYTAAKVGKTLTLALALKTLSELWNNYVFDDEEDDLPENVRKSSHIILGRDANGKVLAFTRVGTSDDLLEWGGLEAAPYYVREYLNGRMSYEDLAKEIAFRPFGVPIPIKPALNKIAQSITPFIKTTAELASGRAWFPNFFEQREIRSRGEYIARELGVTAAYKAAWSKPQSKVFSVDKLLDLFLYRYDPGETHYNAFKYDKVAKWGAEHGEDPGGGLSQKKAAQALYDIRMAIRYDDERAQAAALIAYKEVGGTRANLKESIDRLHPLGSLKKSLRDEYKKSLSPAEAIQLQKAELFWVENFQSKWKALDRAAAAAKLPDKKVRKK
jgi:hypothetical protein